MGMDLVALVAFNGTVFPRPATRAISLCWTFNRLSQATVLPPWHCGGSEAKVLKDNGKSSAF